MTRFFAPLFALALAGACASPPAPTTSTPTAPTALNQRSDTTIDGLAAAQAAGKIQLIDVRTVGEYAEGRVPGAVNVPLDQVGPQHPSIAALSKEEPVYVICASGRRSLPASDQLASLGFKAINVQGGTSGWASQGLPLEK